MQGYPYASLPNGVAFAVVSCGTQHFCGIARNGALRLTRKHCDRIGICSGTLFCVSQYSAPLPKWTAVPAELKTAQFIDIAAGYVSTWWVLPRFGSPRIYCRIYSGILANGTAVCWCAELALLC